MTVTELQQMPMIEFVMWRAFSVWDKAQRELDG